MEIGCDWFIRMWPTPLLISSMVANLHIVPALLSLPASSLPPPSLGSSNSCSGLTSRRSSYPYRPGRFRRTTGSTPLTQYRLVYSIGSSAPTSYQAGNLDANSPGHMAGWGCICGSRLEALVRSLRWSSRSCLALPSSCPSWHCLAFPGWAGRIGRASGKAGCRSEDASCVLRTRAACPPGTAAHHPRRICEPVSDSYWSPARCGLSARRRRDDSYHHPDGRETVVPVGEPSRSQPTCRIPHASVCGGRGRCSTCRIRVVRGLNFSRQGVQRSVVCSTSVGAPPNVRLACRVRPLRDLSVIPLLPAEAQASDGFPQPGYLAGQEQEVTVLFADLRASPGLLRTNCPTMWSSCCNRYFDVVGTAIEQAGGIANQFTGDGSWPCSACRPGPPKAVARRWGVWGRRATINLFLEEVEEEPLGGGIDLHTGPGGGGREGPGWTWTLAARGNGCRLTARGEDKKGWGCGCFFTVGAPGAGLQMSVLPC